MAAYRQCPDCVAQGDQQQKLIKGRGRCSKHYFRALRSGQVKAAQLVETADKAGIGEQVRQQLLNALPEVAKNVIEISKTEGKTALALLREVPTGDKSTDRVLPPAVSPNAMPANQTRVFIGVALGGLKLPEPVVTNNAAVFTVNDGSLPEIVAASAKQRQLAEPVGSESIETQEGK